MKQKPSSRRKRSSAKSILRLPDLEHAKAAVLNSLNSTDAKRGYRHAIMSSLTGIVRNLAWPSTGSWSCAIALISNPINSPPEPSICVLAPFATRLRSSRLRSSQRRFGCRYSSCQRGEEAGHSPRELVDGRARQRALASTRSSATERKT
jgi:hypothetical protein